MVNKINGTEIMLPMKLIMVAWAGDIPSDIPTGIAPLSSIIGNAAVSITLNSMDKKLSS
jgi:hypothetical protein